MENTNGIKRLLLIKMASQHYALPLTNVNEAIGMQPFTKVPLSKQHCLGIINLRGTVVSLIDLAVRLNLRGTVSYDAEESDLGIVVCTMEGRSFGLVVDSIENVISVAAEEIKQCPTVDVNIPEEFIGGVMEFNSDIVLILNVLPLFGKDEINFIQKAA